MCIYVLGVSYYFCLLGNEVTFIRIGIKLVSSRMTNVIFKGECYGTFNHVWYSLLSMVGCVMGIAISN